MNENEWIDEILEKPLAFSREMEVAVSEYIKEQFYKANLLLDKVLSDD